MRSILTKRTRFLLAYLGASLVAVCAASGSGVDVCSGDAQSFRIYPLVYPDGSRDNSQAFKGFVKRLRTAAPTTLSDFLVKISVVPTFVRRDAVYSTHRLRYMCARMRSDVRGACGELKFLPVGETVLAINTGFPSVMASGQDISRPASELFVTDFDELWIDYRDSSSSHTSTFSVHLDMYPRGRAGGFLAIADQTSMRPIGELDLAKAAWRPKDRNYSLARVLRLRPDDTWRYSLIEGKTVLQRRFHYALDAVDSMDLIFGPEVQVEGLVLRVNSGDSLASGKTIEVGEEEVFSDHMGRLVWRVPLRELVKRNFPDSDKAYLQELIVIIKGDVFSASLPSPLKKMVFLAFSSDSHRPSAGSGPEKLPYRITPVSASVKRMAVYLQPLKKHGDAILKGGTLRLPGPKSGIEILGLRLVRLYGRMSPAFVSEGEDLMRRWGGPFTEERAGSVEWPEISAYVPFSAFRPIPAAPVAGRVASSTTNSVGKTFVDRGIVFRSELQIERISPEAGSLSVEGPGKRLEISVPLKGVVKPSSFFFLELPVGSEGVGRMELVSTLATGVSHKKIVVPNRPVPLPISGDLREIKLVIYFAGSPYHLHLGSIAIFTPIRLEENVAFYNKLPVKIDERSVTELVDLGYLAGNGTEVGGANGKLQRSNSAQGRDRFIWKTVFDPPVEWPSTLSLSYDSPASVSISSSCWLNLTLKWAGGSFSRDICPVGSKGELSVPLSEFGGDPGVWPGPLVSAEWRLNGPSESGPFEKSFSFTSRLDGISMRSPSEALQKWSILASGGVPLGVSVSSKNANGILSGSADIVAPPSALLRLVKGGGYIEVLKHPWFSVKSVHVLPVRPLPEEVWEVLIAPLSKSRSAFARTRPALYVLLLFLVWKWRRGIMGSTLFTLMAGKAAALWANFLKSPCAALLKGFSGRSLSGTGIWMSVALSLYSAGLLSYLLGRSGPENYFYTLAAIAMAFSLNGAIKFAEPGIRHSFPSAAGYVFGPRGGIELSGAGISFICAVAVSWIGAGFFAEQLAMVAFYNVCLGAIKYSCSGMTRTPESLGNCGRSS